MGQWFNRHLGRRLLLSNYSERAFLFSVKKNGLEESPRIISDEIHPTLKSNFDIKKKEERK